MKNSKDDSDLYHSSDFLLINKLVIKDFKTLGAIERTISFEVIYQIFNGEYSIKGNFDYEHLKKIHEELFKEIYSFAGKERDIEIYKKEEVLEKALGYKMTALYSSPQNIEKHVEKATQQLKTQDFQNLKNLDGCHNFADVSAKLWLAHPFREGNTRTTLVYLDLLCKFRNMPMDFYYLAEKDIKIRDAFVLATIGKTEILASRFMIARTRHPEKEQTKKRPEQEITR
ncbi:MAG: Fic family protein [Burkholderiales bacterium]|jgi:cell filamentation protein|nr:Fic family protein [Burkholderiales bacterium]